MLNILTSGLPLSSIDILTEASKEAYGEGSAEMAVSRIDGKTVLKPSVLNSDGYKYGIMQEGNPSAVEDLVNASNRG